MWNSYVTTIEPLILGEVKRLDAMTTAAIWLQTEQGTDWLWDNKEENEQGGVPANSEDIVEYILSQYALSAAADWTNRRIEKYLQREHN